MHFFSQSLGRINDAKVGQVKSLPVWVTEHHGWTDRPAVAHRRRRAVLGLCNLAIEEEKDI